MARKNRSPEENECRTKIRKLLQASNISSMDDIRNLFREIISEFVGNGLNAEMDDKLGYSKYDYRSKDTDNSRNGHSSKTLRTSFGDGGMTTSDNESHIREIYVIEVFDMTERYYQSQKNGGNGR